METIMDGHLKLFNRIFIIDSQNLAGVREQIDGTPSVLKEYKSVSQEESKKIANITKAAFKSKMKIGNIVVFGKNEDEDVDGWQQYVAFLVDSDYRRDIKIMLVSIEITLVEAKEESFYIINIIDGQSNEIRQQRTKL